MSDSLRRHGLEPARLLCPWDFPGKNIGVGCRDLLQGIFLTQGSNPNIPAPPALSGRFFTASATWESPRGGSVQFSSVQFSCSVMSDSLRPMNHSMPGLPVHQHLPEFTQTHVHRVHDAIQPSHPRSSPFSSCLQSLPASESFPMSQLFA